MRDLRLVSVIAAEGSLARASLRLHLTPSALSHHLRGLEARAGAPLFLRLGRRMRPTEAGLRLVAASDRVLRALADASSAVLPVERPIVRIGAECYTTYYWLPSVIAAVERAAPEVDVRIADGAWTPVEGLLDGAIDVALVSRPPRDRRVRLSPLFRDELVALVRPDHAWAGRAFVRPEDFATEHVIHYATTRSELTLFADVLRPAGVTPRRVTPVHLTEAILEMVRGGLGVAVLAHWSAAPYVERGLVVPVRVTRRGLTRRWYAATRRRDSPPAAETLIDAMKRPGIFKTSRR